MPTIGSVPMPLFIILLFVPLAGVLEALIPWLVKDRECFAVTIPSAVSRDPRLIRYKRMYSIVMLAAAIAAFAACLPFVSGNSGGSGRSGGLAVDALGVVILVATCAQLVLGFILMLVFRSRVRAIKRAEGWEADAAEYVTVSGADLPRPLPFRWEWAHAVIVVATLALTWALYPQMPEQIVQHVDFSGVPTDYMPKSPLTALFPVFVVVFLAAAMVFAHVTIVRSKRPIDPESPAASALAYALFARMQSVVLCAGGVLINAVIGLSMPLAFAELIPLDRVGALVVAVAFIIVAASVWVAVAYGQSGARAVKRQSAASRGDAAPGAMRVDEDSMWLAGIIYCNRYDPSIFVPKRFGVGWTINVGRPGAWAVIIGFLVVTIGFVVGIGLLVE